MFKRLLVPLDGSHLAEGVMRYARDLALHHKSQVVLFSAVPPAQLTVSESLGARLRPSSHEKRLREKKLREDEEKARAHLEVIAGPLREKGLEVECVTQVGSPADEIIQYAQANNVDLIAICTHGRGGVGRVVFGSVADRVLRESGLPILLLKPHVRKV